MSNQNETKFSLRVDIDDSDKSEADMRNAYLAIKFLFATYIFPNCKEVEHNEIELYLSYSIFKGILVECNFDEKYINDAYNALRKTYGFEDMCQQKIILQD